MSEEKITRREFMRDAAAGVAGTAMGLGAVGAARGANPAQVDNVARAVRTGN
jgi:hypothetical protein